MSSPQDRPEFGRRQGGARTVVPAQQARQGVTGHNVRYVLGIGIDRGDRGFCRALHRLFCLKTFLDRMPVPNGSIGMARAPAMS
jgi:hypothetical protein